jgi:hypothetical protein
MDWDDDGNDGDTKHAHHGVNKLQNKDCWTSERAILPPWKDILHQITTKYMILGMLGSQP